jgi:hypothetical protein
MKALHKKQKRRKRKRRRKLKIQTAMRTPKKLP